MSCHFLLQGIFPSQGLNSGLLHWQAGSLSLSHQGSTIATHIIFPTFLFKFLLRPNKFRWFKEVQWGVHKYTHETYDLGNTAFIQAKERHWERKLLSCVWLFTTPWTAVHQASLSTANSQSLLKLMSIESVMPSNHLILCHLLLFLPSIFASTRVFNNESDFHIRWPSIGASGSVFPMNTQGQFPLGLTDLIFLLSKGLSRVFCNTTVQKH